MSNAVRGKFVLVRVEGADDEDVFKAIEKMGLWTPPNVKLYDKNDRSGVFVYARLYFNFAVTGSQQKPVGNYSTKPAPINTHSAPW